MMKYLVQANRLLIAAFMSITVVFMSFMATAEPAAKDPMVGWAEIKKGATLIDVRTPEEFQQGHLAGAVNIPHQLIVDGVTKLQLAKNTNIVLYCRSGNRAGKAQAKLNEAGFSKVYNAGGYVGMMEAKHKLP